ncbi:MAG: polysaccharide biosynthesis protein [Sediminibacterium sp.]
MNVDKFVMNFLGREKSMFSNDLEKHATALRDAIKGRSILVIGGAGTIGSSFIKAALKFEPSKVVVVDINENGLTELVRDLRSTPDQYIPKEFVTYPLSFDNPAFAKLFKANAPFHIVANFAAHKHVRSEKDIYSVEALIDNNLVKAKVLLDLLKQYPPSHFFCVSTDKAANPVNIMGASKKLMEELIFSYASILKVTTARFANVAFSNGSLLDGFLMRIDKGQPLSCPVDVTRFFVSPQESGEICLMACIIGNTSEIFFPKLDMENDLVNFVSIIQPLLTQFGYTALPCNSEEQARSMAPFIKEGKYPVYYFKTDTSGEKLYEEFYTDEEIVDTEKYTALGVIHKKATYTIEDFGHIIKELQQLLDIEGLEKSDIVNWLKKYIPEFDHIETGLSLDRKM